MWSPATFFTYAVEVAERKLVTHRLTTKNPDGLNVVHKC
jgi:hypothetical protein